MKIKYKQDGYSIRIVPKYSHGIYLYSTFSIIEKNEIESLISVKLELGILIKIVLLILCTVFPIIYIPMILSTDHYYQTVNGINTVVNEKPYWALLMLFFFIFLWILIIGMMLVRYKKKTIEFIYYNFNTILEN